MRNNYDYSEYKEKTYDTLCHKYGTDVVQKIVVSGMNGKHSDAICFRVGTSTASPIVYYDTDKENYTEKDLERFLKRAEEKYLLIKRFTEKEVLEICDWNHVRTKIFPQLINRGKNEKNLSKLPHVNFLDMTVGFFCNTDTLFPEVGMAAMTITSSMKRTWSVTDEQLMEAAMKNLKEQKCEIKSLEEVAAIYGAEVEDRPVTPLYTVSVYTGMFGAAALLNKDFLRRVCERAGCSKLWIIASSVHELMILPYEYSAEAFCAYDTAVVLNEILNPEDMLSDSLYTYDNTTEKVEIYKDK